MTLPPASDAPGDVVVCRDGVVDARIAAQLLPDGLALLTHLPTGAGPPQPTLTIAPGASTAARTQGPEDGILLVIQGCARLRWGRGLGSEAITHPGDLLFIPAGIFHLLENGARRDTVRLAVLRGGTA